MIVNCPNYNKDNCPECTQNGHYVKVDEYDDGGSCPIYFVKKPCTMSTCGIPLIKNEKEELVAAIYNLTVELTEIKELIKEWLK